MSSCVADVFFTLLESVHLMLHDSTSLKWIRYMWRKDIMEADTKWDKAASVDD